MVHNVDVIERSGSVEINKVLKNTYLLVSASLVVCAIAAAISMSLNIAPISFWIYLGVIFGMSFVMAKTANSGLGIVMMFLFAGFLGFYAGPIINYYVARAGTSEIILQSVGLTGLIFFALSGYVLKTGKDFTFLRGFLFAGLMTALGIAVIYALGAYFGGWHISGFSMMFSAFMVLLMSGYILYDTSSIIRGEQTNYILAAMSVFINIYVLFMHILNLLSIFAGDD